MSRWTRAFLARIEPTFLEAWPDSLCALAVPHVGLPLGAEECHALIEAPPLWRAQVTPRDPVGLRTLAERLAPVVTSHPQGAFVRLGSGSPKDSALHQEMGGRAGTAVMAIKFLQTSQRTRDHLAWCLALDYRPHLFVRPWIAMKATDEFRCFVRRRRLVGWSGVRPTGAEARLIAHAGAVAAACPFDSSVLDLHCPDDEGAAPRLLDVNPWGPPTGAAPFDWQRPELFDGRFRSSA